MLHRRRKTMELELVVKWKAGCTLYASTVLDFSFLGSVTSFSTVIFSVASNPFLFLIIRFVFMPFFAFLYYLFIYPVPIFFLNLNCVDLEANEGVEIREIAELSVFVLLD